jgi:hypothetical protein
MMQNAETTAMPPSEIATDASTVTFNAKLVKTTLT